MRDAVSKWPSQDSNPTCSLKDPGLSVQQFLLKSHSQRPSIFSFPVESLCVKNKLGMESLSHVQQGLPEAVCTALVCLTYFICCSTVYRQLYWFSLGKSLPWLPSSPLLLIQPQNVQIHTCVTILALRAEDRIESTSQDRGFCWAMCRWFPLSVHKNLGLFICYLHAVLIGHILSDLPFPSEEGGWKN